MERRCGDARDIASGEGEAGNLTGRSRPNVLENERGQSQSCPCVIEGREVRIGGAPEHAGNIE